MALGDWIDRFAVWNGVHPDLQTLLIYGIGVAGYTALVFAFYQNMSARDPFHRGSGNGFWARALHTGETILTFPILSFGYFLVLALSLFLMAKPDRATSDILLLSMACVVAVRFTAHLSERMANDLAKLLPLGLLGVVLVDPGYLSLAGTISRVGEAVAMTPVLLQYFVIFILFEAALRGVRALFPSLNKAAHEIEHKHKLSKKAMLRDVEHEHGGKRVKMFHHEHHEHAPRDRAKDFMTLDESTGGKPGSRQGVGPAIQREMHMHAHGHAPAAAVRKPAAKAGPGGSGGKFATMP